MNNIKLSFCAANVINKKAFPSSLRHMSDIYLLYVVAELNKQRGCNLLTISFVLRANYRSLGFPVMKDKFTSMVNDGLVIYKGSNIRVTSLGLLVLAEINKELGKSPFRLKR